MKFLVQTKVMNLSFPNQNKLTENNKKPEIMITDINKQEIPVTCPYFSDKMLIASNSNSNMILQLFSLIH